MLNWLTDFVSLKKLAKKKGKHRTTLSRRFGRIAVEAKILPLRSLPDSLVLILDGTKIAPKTIVLVAYEYLSKQPLAWAFVEREKFETWGDFLMPIEQAYSVHSLVSDGQKGLKKAISLLFPDALHQRCVAHVVRLSLSWLTKHPQSEAARELRSLVCTLSSVLTEDAARKWEADLRDWDNRHAEFIAHKSLNPMTGRNRHTHRKLRAVRSLILNALPDLFRYTKDSRIPSTTNDVEGGINSPLKELLHRHRGITKEEKMVLVSQYLYNRRAQKSPTRNAT
jgi:transposase-like protein